MEKIISLSSLITRQKIFQVALIDELFEGENKMSKLYQNILMGKIKNDNDALRILYPESPKVINLKKLKERLYNRMVNSVLFLDQSGSNYKDIFKAYQSCYKNYSVIKILMVNRKVSLGADLAMKTLKISTRYEFTDLNYLLSSILVNYYLSKNAKFRLYEKYLHNEKYYLEALNAENYIERLYKELGNLLSKSSSGLNPKEIEYYQNETRKVQDFQKSINTTKFNLNAYLFQANLFLELKQYTSIIELVQDGKEFYLKKGIKSVQADYTLQTRAALSYFMLKMYDKAEELYKQNLTITSPDTTNWFATYNHYFALKIAQNKLLDGYLIISKVFNTKEFEKTNPLVIQLFKIKEAYIHFLVTLGKIDPSQSSEEPLRKFRLNRFLNDVPTYSKDKRGANISILIIQMLLLVQNKKFGQVLDRLDSLNMYSHRYLRGDNTFRSNCFIKMLAKLPDADYHPIRWARYVKKFRDRLDEHPFELSYHNLDLEVIPFETLYDLVIEMLEKR